MLIAHYLDLLSFGLYERTVGAVVSGRQDPDERVHLIKRGVVAAPTPRQACRDHIMLRQPNSIATLPGN